MGLHDTFIDLNRKSPNTKPYTQTVQLEHQILNPGAGVCSQIGLHSLEATLRVRVATSENEVERLTHGNQSAATFFIVWCVLKGREVQAPLLRRKAKSFVEEWHCTEQSLGFWFATTWV